MRFGKSIILGFWLVVCLIIFLTGLRGSSVQACPQPQTSCEKACACEGFDAATVWSHYGRRELAPNSYSVYVYPSLCAEKYGYWTSGGAEPLEDILRKIGYFLDEQKALCEKCRNASQPTAAPTLAVVAPPPAEKMVTKPTVVLTRTATPKPPQEFPNVRVVIEDAPLGKRTAPYRGVTADGLSTLDVHLINDDAARPVQVQIGITGPGELTMKDGKATGSSLSLPPSSRTTLRYVPPDYVDEGLLTARSEVTLDVRLFNRGDKFLDFSSLESSRYRFAHAVPVNLNFTFVADDSPGPLLETLDVLVFRPPLMMVHGYLGSEDTWAYLEKFLSQHKFVVYAGSYDPAPEVSRIEDMANLLQNDVDHILASYMGAYIKTSRVDLITHSMGGLISRTYVKNHPYDTVRKLIMLATPNHGVNDWQRLTRVGVSSILRQHVIASYQLNSDDAFFEWLNEGENELKHLVPEVEYANLIGRASCGPGCPHDAVVDISSAHLNGVPGIIFNQTIHSQSLLFLNSKSDVANPFFKSTDIGITDSPSVAEKLHHLLTTPIQRAAPDEKWSMALINGTGEVSISRRFSGYMEMVREYPLPLQNFHEIRTGVDGKALMAFYLRGKLMSRIAIKPNTTLGFNVSAAGELSVWLQSGEGRFTRYFNESGELFPNRFQVTVGNMTNAPEGKVFNPVMQVRDLQTDFIVSAGTPPGVSVLEGSVWLDTFNAQGEPLNVGETLTASPDVFIRLDQAGGLVPQPVLDERWWTDPLYTDKYPVPTWAQDPAGGLRLFGAKSRTPLPAGSALEPAWVVIGCSVSLGALMLIVLAIVFLFRWKKGRQAAHNRGWAGLPGLLVALAFAGLMLACFGAAAGVLLQQGILHLPGSQSLARTAPLLEATRRPPAVITLPEDSPYARPEVSAPGDDPAANSLSAEGGWVVIAAEDGIWAMNEDGSGLSRLNSARVVAPQNLRAGVSPERAELAYIAAIEPGDDTRLALNLMSLPDGRNRVITPLLSAEIQLSADANICDPNFEASRAARIGNSLAWSPDGQFLAFTAALQGLSSDVYIYSVADDQIARVSDEPGQAYDLNWSPEGSYIVYFSAYCFGTGAGFDMEGVYSLEPGKGSPELLYQPNREGYGEEFITWLLSGANGFFTATRSGCPLRDLRLVDVNTRQVRTIFPGCFEDYAVGPTSMLAVLTSRDLSDNPGLSLFTEPGLDLPSVFISNEEGRLVEFSPPSTLFMVQSAAEAYKEVLSFEWNGTPGWYHGIGEFPVFAVDGETWLWEMSGKFYLGGFQYPAPVVLLDQAARYPMWYEDLAAGDVIQRGLYFSEEPSSLFMLSSPDFRPVQMHAGLKPVYAPVVIFP